MIDPTAQVHPSAEIEAGATVGAATRIWRRAHVRSGARVGDEVVIGADVFVDADVAVGNRVKIQNGAQLFHGLTVEDGVFIGPGAILTNDRYPRAILPSGEPATAEDWTVSPITLRHGASVGAGAIVVAGTEVGAYSLVGAGAVVTRDVPAHALVAGNPARQLGWVCTCGRRLTEAAGERQLDCVACGRAFDLDPGSGALVERRREPHEVTA